MSRIKLYVDEDAMQQALAAGLRARGVDVVTASDEGLVNRGDEEHLRRAPDDGQTHHGIVLAAQQRYPAGEQLRRLSRLRTAMTPSAMRDRIEYLSNWA